MKGPRVALIVLLISIIILSCTGRALATRWVKYGRNPVLTPTPNGWDVGGVYLPRVVHDDTTFRMWYLGYGEHLHGPGMVGYAVSSDGVNWKKYPKPVLLPGSQGAWDSSSVTGGSVIRNGTHYVMWYRGLGPSFEFGAVGLATSADGINWTKYPTNPILTNRSFGVQVLDYPNIVRSGKEYKMWCVGQPAGQSLYQIFYATSDDGVNWKERPEPVLGPDTGGWDAYGIYDPTVIFSGSGYWMWYSSHPGIGYATSKDGLSWTKSIDNPILSRGPVGSWDRFSVGNQGVVVFNGSVLLYFSAAKAVRIDEANSSIGLALSLQEFTISETPLQAAWALLGVALLVSSIMFACSRKAKLAIQMWM